MNPGRFTPRLPGATLNTPAAARKVARHGPRITPLAAACRRHDRQGSPYRASIACGLAPLALAAARLAALRKLGEGIGDGIGIGQYVENATALER